MRARAGYRGRGLIAFDALIALLMMAVVTVALLQTEGMQRRAERALNDRRTACRVLEARALTMEAGVAPLPAPDGAVLRVRPVTGGDAIRGRTWVELTCDYRGQHASLTALLPLVALSGQAGQVEAGTTAPHTPPEAEVRP